MCFRRKTSAGRAYLQIVESRRDGDQVRQQVIATLGRFDELQASGQLERLVRSGARFAAKAMVLSAASNDAAIEIAVRRIGPALVFERLWEETGCRAVVSELAGQRKHGFALERAVLLTVLHRLLVSGSDRAADRWREDYAIAGVERLDPRHDQHRDHGGARGAAAVVHPGGTRAVGQAGTRAGARRSSAVRTAGAEEARQANRLRGQDGDAG